MVTGTKAVITAGIDSYNEYKMKNSTVVDKNTLYEGSDYTFEWSISDDPNVTLTSNANQCELQVGNQSQEGRFKLSLKNIFLLIVGVELVILLCTLSGLRIRHRHPLMNCSTRQIMKKTISCIQKQGIRMLFIPHQIKTLRLL